MLNDSHRVDAALPKDWPRRVRSAVVHAISMSNVVFAVTRSHAENHFNARVRLQAQNDRLLREVALLTEEVRIKDARMERLPAQRRPHYPPIERLAILELRAARGWSLAQTARRLLVTPLTVASWTKRLDDEGPDALVQLRDIPMSEAAQEVLAGQVRHLTSPMVFVRPDGSDYTSDAARTRLSQLTTKVMRDAGVHDASFHTLRHTAAAWMVQAGVSLHDVQNILGHSTPMMTTRYAHLQPDHLRRAVTALDRKLNSSKDRSTSRKTGE